VSSLGDKPGFTNPTPFRLYLATPSPFFPFGKGGVLVYLTPFVPLSLRGVKGEGGLKKRGFASLKLSVGWGKLIL